MKNEEVGKDFNEEVKEEVVELKEKVAEVEKNEVKKLKKIHSHKTPTTHNFFFVLSYDLPIYNREVKNSLPP